MSANPFPGGGIDPDGRRPSPPGGDATGRLAAAVTEGTAQTVRVCFSDHYGTLRGRRVAAEDFAGAPRALQGFCDGALVWDVAGDMCEAVRFSNYATGFPDVFARPDLETVRPCGWAPGEWMALSDLEDGHGAPVPLDPRQVLRSVLARAGDVGAVVATLDLAADGAAGWDAGAPPPWGSALAEGLRASGLGPAALQPVPDRQRVRVTLGPLPALALADAAALARTAARELGRRHGARVLTVPRRAAGDEPACLTFRLPGAAGEGTGGRLDDLALLLAPLPLGYPRPEPSLAAVGDGLSVHASSDANPWLALAATVAALGARAARTPRPGPAHYRDAIARLAAADWAAAWFDDTLLHDALALAGHEADLRERRVSSWDLERYGGGG